MIDQRNDLQQRDRIRLEQIRNVPQIINATFDFVRQNIRLLFRALLITSFGPILIVSIAFGYFYQNFLESMIGRGSMEGMVAMVPLSFLLMIVGAVAVTTLIGVVHIVVDMYRTMSPEEFAGATAGDIISRVKRVFWKILGSAVVLGIGYFLISLILVIIPGGGPIAIFVLITFGLCYFPYRIYEGRGVITSFRESAQLVSGKWWKAFGLLSLQYLIITPLTVGFIGIPIIIATILGFNWQNQFEQMVSGGSFFGYLMIFFWTMYMTVSFMLLSLSMISSILFYFSQKERKEAPGLSEEIELLGTDLGGEAGVQI